MKSKNLLLALYLTGLTMSAVAQSTPSVSITSVYEGNTVKGITHTIEGTITGYSPDHHRIYLLVHPMSTQQWWAQNNPIVNEKAGSWNGLFNLGSSEGGNNDTYIIRVLVMDREIDTRSALDEEDVPKGLASEQITLKREDSSFIEEQANNSVLVYVLTLISVVLGIIGFLGFRKRRRENTNTTTTSGG